MKRAVGLLAAAALLWGIVPPRAYAGAWEDTGLWLPNGVSLVNNDKAQLDVYGRAQMMGTGEIVPDPKAAHQRVYLFLNEARTGIKGRYEDYFKYDVQMDWGGESINGSNTDMSLLDMVADVPVRALGDNAIVKIGQFRVPYSREGLTDTGYMDYTDRSIASFMSFQGRDYGLALMDNWGNFTGTFGTFSGGGRNVPQRYLPEQIGVPEMVARFGYNDGADVDIYHVMGTDRNLKRNTKAFYIDGIYMGDTRIGHSTALGVHTVDDNLLINSNYNPYLKWGDNTATSGGLCSALTCERGSIFFLGTDGVVRHRIDDTHSAEVEYEGNWGGYQNRFGVLHMASGRVQGDYQSGPFEIGLRGAVLSMGDASGFLATSGPGATGYATKVNQSGTSTYYYNEQMGQPIWEITPSVTWHISPQHNMKIVAALPIFLDAPLWIDNADGTYVFTDPTPSGGTLMSTDQGSVLETAGNNTVRRTIPEARMTFQFQF